MQQGQYSGGEPKSDWGNQGQWEPRQEPPRSGRGRRGRVGPGAAAAANAMPAERIQFIQRTYMHLIGAIAATVVGMFLFAFSPLYVPVMTFLFESSGNTGWFLVLGLFIFGTMFAEHLAHRTSRALQYVGLFTSVAIFSLILNLPVAFALASGGGQVVIQALMITFFTFGALTVMVFRSGIDFSILRTGLVVGGVLSFGAIIAAIFFGFTLGLGFIILMVGYMAAMITYQTSEIYHKYRTDQHVGAATGLYVSVGILFWYVLHLVGWGD